MREASEIELIWAENLPDGVLGATNGKQIWLSSKQFQTERRCTLTHELVHIELGHDGCQPVAVEKQVCVEAARRLITIDQLRTWLPWALSMEELAECLWVDEDTLKARLENLTAEELQELSTVLSD
ncbi:ImmA/IrrE family metallo-endopeptidase [Schaalia turicensis]|uniref:ImmA/IrrE family metallo-endopeptidase n=1 Tax=Schaalia turicensis TaxID=131111 RepID=UPI0003120B71|nr:ImmA/IrrE family metallo-endopeptidase [Schaalia turicensis]